MQVKLITGVTGDQDLGAVMLRSVRVAGTAALAGAVVIKRGTTTFETMAIATAIGTERLYHDSYFANTTTEKLQINLANSGDSVLVFYS